MSCELDKGPPTVWAGCNRARAGGGPGYAASEPEVRFVNAVTAGGSVKFLPAV